MLKVCIILLDIYVITQILFIIRALKQFVEFIIILKTHGLAKSSTFVIVFALLLVYFWLLWQMNKTYYFSYSFISLS